MVRYRRPRPESLVRLASREPFNHFKGTNLGPILSSVGVEEPAVTFTDGFMVDQSGVSANLMQASSSAQPTLVERAAQFEPLGPIVQEKPARGGWREYTLGSRYRSAADGLAEVHEAPFFVERE